MRLNRLIIQVFAVNIVFVAGTSNAQGQADVQFPTGFSVAAAFDIRELIDYGNQNKDVALFCFAGNPYRSINSKVLSKVVLAYCDAPEHTKQQPYETGAVTILQFIDIKTCDEQIQILRSDGYALVDNKSDVVSDKINNTRFLVHFDERSVLLGDAALILQIIELPQHREQIEAISTLTNKTSFLINARCDLIRDKYAFSVLDRLALDKFSYGTSELSSGLKYASASLNPARHSFEITFVADAREDLDLIFTKYKQHFDFYIDQIEQAPVKLRVDGSELQTKYTMYTKLKNNAEPNMLGNEVTFRYRDAQLVDAIVHQIFDNFADKSAPIVPDDR